MEEENWRNKHQSDFNKIQKTVGRVVKIIWKIFWKMERKLPNNFQKVLRFKKKKKWHKNLNCDGISQLFHGNCDKNFAKDVG